MAQIKIPCKFASILQKNQFLDGIVKITSSHFGEILEQNKLYFFDEYTNHGILHIESVLDSSANLIKSETYSLITATDVAHYILAVILHDLGMHIDFEGFNFLLEGGFETVRNKEIDTLSWKELWDSFLVEVKRFSGKQIKAIFGDENLTVSIPKLNNKGQLTENDKKLIGEFIRRNHPRLAHEISLMGFPGNNKTRDFCSDLKPQVRNLIGLIARSHGMELRQSTFLLEKLFGKNNIKYPFETHAVFLMVILRIADYMQIDSSRISPFMLKIKSFSSPISELEHYSHLSIDSIDFMYQNDPERIYVKASPNDSEMYLKLKNLFTNIQYEIDISWAVLGEVYGLHSPKPEMKYRRIISNLEDSDFVSSQEYVADKFIFNANDEIIKLLIAPLYGDNPSFGVRELLQNSVDACKERELIENRNGNSFSPSIDVSFSQEFEGVVLKIEDNGIGMNVEVIKNYFLSAGASYRRSLDWQKQFMTDIGKTMVRRSGRFGIGILAAFLIGNKFEVKTRHVNSRIGYTFVADLNSTQINVFKVNNIDIGTSIKIKVSKEALLKLTDTKSRVTEWFEWFTLVKPSITYSFLGENVIPYLTLNPDLDNIPTDWNALDSEGFSKILWTYSEKYVKESYFCNGIIINNFDQIIEKKEYLNLGVIRLSPRISVFDNEGNLPLTLNRNGFADRLPFEYDLLKDIYKDFISYILTLQIGKIEQNNKIRITKNNTNYSGIKTREGFIKYGNDIYNDKLTLNYMSEYYDNNYSYFNVLDNILFSKKGFILNYHYFLKKNYKTNTILLQTENNLPLVLDLDLNDNFLYLSTDRVNSIDDYRTAIEAQEFNSERSYQMYNARFFLKTPKYEYLFEPFESNKRLSRWLKSNCKVIYKADKWTCFEIGKPKDSSISNGFLHLYQTSINFIREFEIFCPHTGDELLNDLLGKYIGEDYVIPYSLNERREKYKLAFNELEMYMRKYVR